jgi:hypothetical protein
MKGTTLRNAISLSVIGILFASVMVFAQDKEEKPQLKADGTYSTSQYNQAERPDDSYLAKFHAKDVVTKLIKQNLDQIYLLKVIVTNFADKGWKGDYDKVYDGYRKAMNFYYQRNVIYSRRYLEENRQGIQDLMKKISDDYKVTLDKMLEESAEKILMLYLDATTQSDPNKYRELQQNEMRLKIAYGQYDDAVKNAMYQNYETSIYHFRVAKTYGISILESLAEDGKAVADQYKVHRADNMNRIFEENKSAGGEKKAQ